MGEKLGTGKTLEEALEEMTMVAEGVRAARMFRDRAIDQGIEIPFTKALNTLLDGDIEAEECCRRVWFSWVERRFPHMEGRYPPIMSDDNSSDLTDFEAGLLEWLCENNFHVEPWSTEKAAKQFYVEEDAIYEAVAALTRKVPQRIQVFYKNGTLHIAAD